MLLCACWSALAAWFSLGTIGFQATHAERIGVLPMSMTAIAVMLTAAVVVAYLLRIGAPRAPLSLLLLVLLPWLPGARACGVSHLVGSAVDPRVDGRRRDDAGTADTGGGTTTLLFLPPMPVRAGLLALLLFGAAAWRTAPVGAERR